MKTLKINNCPFCKDNKVEFYWSCYMSHGYIKCANQKAKCYVSGPQVYYKKYDNEQRIINRAIKKWNKGTK